MAHTEVSIETAPLDTSATGNDIRGGDWVDEGDDDDDDDVVFFGGGGRFAPKKTRGVLLQMFEEEKMFLYFLLKFWGRRLGTKKVGPLDKIRQKKGGEN